METRGPLTKQAFQNILSYLHTAQHITNRHYLSFFESLNQPLHLPDYLCFCVGRMDAQDLTKQVHCIQFHEYCVTNAIHYKITWHYSSTERCTFWVYSGCTLRHNFFRFLDQLTLFRGTFLYVPESGLHRLSILKPHLHIPLTLETSFLCFRSPCSQPCMLTVTPPVQPSSPTNQQLKTKPEENSSSKESSPSLQPPAKRARLPPSLHRQAVQLFINVQTGLLLTQGAEPSNPSFSSPKQLAHTLILQSLEGMVSHKKP